MFNVDPMLVGAVAIFATALLILAGRARGHRIIRDAHIHQTLRGFHGDE